MPGCGRKARVRAPPYRPIVLRRLLCAYLAFRIAEFGVWIGLAAAAYTFGGVREATVVMLVQLVPAALVASRMSEAIRCHGATMVIRIGLSTQAAGMVWCAAWLATNPAGSARLAGYAGAVVAAVAVTATRPAMACLLPRLVRDDTALARANGAVGAADGIGMLLGPAVAAVLLAGSGVAAVFATMAALNGVGALLTAGLPAGIACPPTATAHRSLADDFRLVLASPSARVVTGLLAMVSLLIGALDLAFVVTAVDILHLSASAAAWLNAAFGVGMVLGGVLFGAARRSGFARWIVSGLAAWAVLLLALSVNESVWIAAAMLAGGGIGAACAEVAGRTLLQRIAGHERLGEAFSIVESTQMAALAVGTLTVGSAVQEFGPRGALVVPALVLLGVTAATARAVHRSERYATRSVVQFA